MKKLKGNATQMNDYLCVKTLLFVIFQLLSLVMFSQNKYEIRLEKQNQATVGKSCYAVQIRSGSDDAWHLAGQNYRLFYDASKATFKSGESLLVEDYQQFRLVQDLSVDASNVEGELSFAESLGFLNYSMDLLNTSEASALVPNDGSWLSTAQLCFETVDVFEEEDQTSFCQVWARKDFTNKYAPFFTEISAWKAMNQIENTIGTSYEDLVTDCESQETSKLEISAKVFLQGAYNTDTELMNDHLRRKELIPISSPYNALNTPTTQQQIEEKVFKTEGSLAVVDWVLVELRNANNPVDIAYTKAGLLLRNGQIVAIDGKSPININALHGNYFVSVRHRNHLGVMTEEPVNFQSAMPPFVIDFTQPNTPVFGENARISAGELMLLWGGNADGNAFIVFQGAGLAIPDPDKIFFDVFLDEKNTKSFYNHITKGYLNSDVNMDGEIKYQGGNNDIDELIFFNIFAHPSNSQHYTNFYIEEQIPRLSTN